MEDPLPSQPVGSQVEELPTQRASSPTTRRFPSLPADSFPWSSLHILSLSHLGSPTLASPEKMEQWVSDCLNTQKNQDEERTQQARH